MRRISLVLLPLLFACAPAALSTAQRMELIERLDQSAAFAKQCGLGRSEMRVRFAALPDGTIAEPHMSPHEAGLIVRTERLLPTGRVQTDQKLLAADDGLTRAYLDQIVGGAEEAVRGCAEKKGTHGAATVFFLIDPDGHVSDVLVESKLAVPDVEWCVLDVFRGLRFDRPARGGYVEVTRPVRL